MSQKQAREVLVRLERGAAPLQRQVEDQLRAGIREGRLVAGERLPSSRVLAEDLAVSRGVISDAYGQLAAEGWLLVAPRSGPRVAGDDSARGLASLGAVAQGAPAPAGLAGPARGLASLGAVAQGAPAPAGLAGPAAAGTSRMATAGGTGGAAGARGAGGAGAGAGAPVRYDLRPGRPDLSRFPRADWLRSLGAAVRGAGDAELDYPPLAGSTRLRTVLAAYRGRVRGTLAAPDDVLVCLGAAQAFITIAVALGPAKIAVENPGHGGIRELLRVRGLEPVPTRVDGHGIVVDELPDDARLVLVTPAHQFPTGVVMSAQRRAELLRWAQDRGAIVVEDDYDAEYRYDRAPIGALQGLRPDLVFHVGSVSKTLAPALRLGWLIAPPAWRERLHAAREGLDHGLPALEQHALADFIERGAYDRHIRRSARTYRRRRDALLEALATALPEARISGAAAGLHVAVEIPGADEYALVAACRARGVVLDGAAPHGGTAPTLLISFAAVPDAASGHVAQLIASAL